MHVGARGVTDPMIICVLGMHRSGTSVATRLINLLGADVGPENLLVRPAADNPKGYWEHQPIVELNDEILARFGGRSMAPPDFPVGWQLSPELDDLRTRGRAIVHESFAAAPLWVWKDPRACLTLPFWQTLLPPMRYVICVRHPKEVARSLDHRNRITRERSVYLWLLYMQGALSHTTGQPRFLAFHDQLMGRPAEVFSDLARFLGEPDLVEQPAVRDEAAAFVDRQLWHHRTHPFERSVQPSGNDLSDTALDLADCVYTVLARPGQLDEKEVEASLDAALEAARPSAFPRPALRRRKRDAMTLASVVVNNYNYGRFLREAIDSALSQTYAPLEVVVVDDGSTDESRDVIESYGNRIITVMKENGGQASAFNAGFAASHGDVVIFLDADDVLLPTAVERAMAVFEPGVVKVHWPLWEIDAAGIRNGNVQPETALEEGDLRDRTILEGPIAGNSPPTSGNAWSRELLERLLPVPEQEFRISADGYLLMLAWLYGKVRTIPEPLSLYRIHGQNLYASYSAEERLARHLAKFSDHCDALEAHLRAMGGVPNPDEWRRWKGIYDPFGVELAKEQLTALIPADATFILVDDEAWADPTDAELFSTRKIPFLERDGEYWGKPADDAEAIAELDRLRSAGAGFIAFAWTSFWWLELYADFSAQLGQRFTCILSNERLLVFDLRG